MHPFRELRAAVRELMKHKHYSREDAVAYLRAEPDPMNLARQAEICMMFPETYRGDPTLTAQEILFTQRVYQAMGLGMIQAARRSSCLTAEDSLIRVG